MSYLIHKVKEEEDENNDLYGNDTSNLIYGRSI